VHLIPDDNHFESSFKLRFIKAWKGRSCICGFEMSGSEVSVINELIRIRQ
jgi:hypothetical protein